MSGLFLQFQVKYVDSNYKNLQNLEMSPKIQKFGLQCHRWNVAINVNCHHESRHEFWILLKLQYRPSRWVKLVEAMAITHFIEGVYTNLINKLSFTCVGHFERLFK